MARKLLGVVTVLGMAACSSTSSGTTGAFTSAAAGSGSGSSGTTSSGAGSGSGSGSNGTTSGSGNGSSGTAIYSGTVTLSAQMVEGMSIFGAAAGFSTLQSGGSGCTQTASNPCCYTAASDGGTTSTATFVSAGTITLTDNSATIGTMSYTAPTGIGTGYAPLSSLQDMSLMWSTGDSLSVSATGAAAGVDAFSGSVTLPAPLTGITPALSETSPISVSASAPFTISWTPGTEGNVSVALTAVSGTTEVGGIECIVANSLGTLTVPASLLGHFAAGEQGAISVGPYVDLAPSTPAANAAIAIGGSGMGANGTLTITN